MPEAAAGRRGPWIAARLAMIALVLWAVIDVLRTIVAIGYYEHRINVGVHGSLDPVLPALMAYELLDGLLPRGTAITAADTGRNLASLVAAAAFIAWFCRARLNAGRLGGPVAKLAPPGHWWASVLVTVALHGLNWLYRVVTSDGGRFEKTALDRRIVAYPMWTTVAVMVVVTAFLTARMVWRITEAQQRIEPSNQDI